MNGQADGGRVIAVHAARLRSRWRGREPDHDKGDTAMAYGHAERTLATIRLLERETRELLSREEHLDPEQARWLREAAESACRRLRSATAARLTTPCPTTVRSAQPGR